MTDPERKVLFEALLGQDIIGMRALAKGTGKKAARARAALPILEEIAGAQLDEVEAVVDSLLAAAFLRGLERAEALPLVLLRGHDGIEGDLVGGCGSAAHLRYTIQREILLRRWAHEPGMQAYRVSAGLEALPPVPPSEPLQTDAIPDVLGMPIARAEQLARQLLRVPEIIRRLRADGFVPAVAQTGCVQ